MRIKALQLDLVWENKTQNLEKIEHLLQSSAAADLIVLPEMFTTGFTMQPEKVAETMTGTTIEWLKTMAAQHDAAIVGSFVCTEGGQYFNRLVWVQPDGVVIHYDKRHRFTLAGEDKHYAAGEQKSIINWRGWRICPLICYDLRFPVWARYTPEQPYDLLIYVANWPNPRIEAWRTLLQARAIENQCYVVGVNRCGTDNAGNEHNGSSAFIDYTGMRLLELQDTEGVLENNFTLENQDNFRQKFAFLNDADKFSMH